MDQVFDLFDNLGATDEQLDFPVVYASALNGIAGLDPEEMADDMTADMADEPVVVEVDEGPEEQDWQSEETSTLLHIAVDVEELDDSVWELQSGDLELLMPISSEWSQETHRQGWAVGGALLTTEEA